MCVTPVPLKVQNLKNKTIFYGNSHSGVISVPCGRCYECRRTHINGWIYRITNEYKAKATRRAWFITLTYSDDSLYNDSSRLITSDGELTLNYSHHQAYMKRLRKSYGNGKSNIKYFTVGEYGDRTGRPHFHSIIFNADQDNILNAWPHGNVHFGEVNEATITYTMKYAMKKLGRVYKPKEWKEIIIDAQLQLLNKEALKNGDTPLISAPERSLISRGIGLEYVHNINNQKFYQNDIHQQIRKENGVTQSLPRYYKDKFYTADQLAVRSSVALSKMEEKNTPEGLRERQAVSRQKFAKEEKNQRKRANSGFD